jgi:hypothetical protein
MENQRWMELREALTEERRAAHYSMYSIKVRSSGRSRGISGAGQPGINAVAPPV